MKVGARVMALGKGGVITEMQENTLDGVEYVYYISVKLDGLNHEGIYHPSDVEECREESELKHLGAKL